MISSVKSVSLARQLAIIDSMAAIRGRKSPKADVFIFESPKNSDRFAVETAEVYISSILMEGDPQVDWYLPERQEVTFLSNDKLASIEIDMAVCYCDGRFEWLKHVEGGTKRPRAQGEIPNTNCKSVRDGRVGRFRQVSTFELSERMIEFHNWLLLCGAITRCRHLPRERETQAVMSLASATAGTNLLELGQLRDCDPAILLAVVADGLRTGVFQCDLEKSNFTIESRIFRI